MVSKDGSSFLNFPMMPFLERNLHYPTPNPGSGPAHGANRLSFGHRLTTQPRLSGIGFTYRRMTMVILSKKVLRQIVPGSVAVTLAFAANWVQGARGSTPERQARAELRLQKEVGHVLAQVPQFEE